MYGSFAFREHIISNNRDIHVLVEAEQTPNMNLSKLKIIRVLQSMQKHPYRLVP